MAKSMRRNKVVSINVPWSIGIIEIPISIKDTEGTIYLMLILESDLIVSSNLLPTKDLSKISWLIEKSFLAPSVGSPRKPKKVIIDDRTGLANIKFSLSNIEVVYEKIPSLDDLVTEMLQQMNQTQGLGPWNYKEYPEEMMNRFFEMTYIWADQKIWNEITDSFLIKVSSKHYQISDMLISIMGNGGESFGLLFFASEQVYKEMMRQHISSEKRITEKLLAMNFVSLNEVDGSLLEAASKNEWPYVDPDFFPLLDVYRENQTREQASPQEYSLVSDVIDAMLAYFAEVLGNKSGIIKKIINVDGADIQLEFPIIVNPY